jgi:fatty-acyl-CoA synthase
MGCEVAFEAIEKHRVSNIFMVPTILKRLAEDPAAMRFDHSSLKHVIYAVAPMYKADQQRALAALGPVMVQYLSMLKAAARCSVLAARCAALRSGHRCPRAPTANGLKKIFAPST